MKIFPKKEKSTPGWGYWGDYGEISMGFSSGTIDNNEDYPGEPLHYHKEATIYILALEGSGMIQVSEQAVEVEKNQLLVISPGEPYKVVGAKQTPFKWLAISTNKNPDDKVVV